MGERAAAARGWAVLSAVVPALVLAATACGGGGDGGGRSPAAPSPGSAGRPAEAAGPPVPTAERLEEAALRDGARIGGPGTYEIGVPLLEGPSEDFLEYRADRAVCQPLVSLARGATGEDPAAEVNREAVLGEGIGQRQVSVQLRSYGSGGAARVLAALREAGTACAGGFVEERGVAEARYRSVEPLEAPDLGDEAVAYRLRIEDVKDRELVLTEYLTVVRSGATTLSFRLEAFSLDDPGGVPRELVAAQWDAFTRAGAGPGA
ncbi:hypothetical protein [Streptomyces sp. URMC 125]|uniref:hypothetical protein n=1 Tax=Streptomyces sp. URMC 125 TaxID=3423419 RepID=UPI003F1BA6E7